MSSPAAPPSASSHPDVMSDTPPRPGAPARSDELIETGNPAINPLSGTPPAPGGSDRSTVPNVRPRAPTLSDFPEIAGYEIIEKIGEGGMGAVYRATKLSLGRVVALKTMRPELAKDEANRARFFHEPRAAAAVRHANIVNVMHVGEAADGTPFIEMEFLAGEPLDARLRREPFAALGLILRVAREVAAGLAAAHAAGLVHRDIKPANVWLERDPGQGPEPEFARCKILDFGVARLGGAHLTTTGAILGTPVYMPPEQARGEPVDHRADLYSLGVTLYRMATGQVPFRGDNPYAVVIAVTTETPPSVRALAPDLPSELLDLIERLMRKNADERPGSAAEVAVGAAAIERRVTAGEPRSLALDRTRTFVGPKPGPEPGSGAGRSTRPAAPPRRATRDRLAELAGAAALVPLATAACALLWRAVEPWATWTLAARAFLLATALAWAVVLVGRTPARGGWRRWVRYAVQFVIGAGVGALALWCDGWAVPVEEFAAAWVGLQYAIHFGLAVCACRWWCDRIGALATNGWRTVLPSSREWWRLVLPPVMLILLLVAWPRDFAPLELAAVVLVAAMAAQLTRPLTRSAGAPIGA
ncbi:MAG: serine/threonine protein kinase [Planctomycetes bacterium]|nr:serine/threonine protein kinase [Planctomycetota bacterium]